MSEGTRRGGEPKTSEEPAGDIMLTGSSVTYGEAGTDEHMLHAEIGPVGLGEPVPEAGEPIIRDTAATVGDVPLENCAFAFVFNATSFWCDEYLGWLVKGTSDGY